MLFHDSVSFSVKPEGRGIALSGHQALWRECGKGTAILTLMALILMYTAVMPCSNLPTPLWMAHAVLIHKTFPSSFSSSFFGVRLGLMLKWQTLASEQSTSVISGNVQPNHQGFGQRGPESLVVRGLDFRYIEQYLSSSSYSCLLI